MSPDFAEQARSAFERDDHMPDTRSPPPDPSNKSLVLVTAIIVAVALALILGVSLPCDHEFWGGFKVGLGAVCQ